MAGHTHGATEGRGLWLSLGLTLAFVAAEACFGLRAHSLALVSDAGHNASDALALGLAAYAIWVARKPGLAGEDVRVSPGRDPDGAGECGGAGGDRAGDSGGGVAGVPAPVPVQGTTMMAVAGVAVLMNTVIAWSLRGDSHHSLNARAAYVHMAGDALSSLGVVLAGLVINLTGWTLADPLVSVLIAGFILYSSWGIIGEASNILMEGTPKGVDVEELADAIRATPPVCDVHDLHVWTVSDGLHFLSCHVVLPDDCSVAESQGIVAALNARLHDGFGIGHATIQTETAEGNACRHDREELYCAMHSARGGVRAFALEPLPERLRLATVHCWKCRRGKSPCSVSAGAF